MSNKRMLALVALLIGICALAAGCGGSSSTAASAAGSATSSGAESESSSDPSISLPAEKIGILNVNNADPGAALLESAAKEAAETLGWSTVSIDAGGDPSKMAAGMQQLVAEKVGAVLLDAVDPAAVTAGLRQAHAAGIPVVLYGGAGTQSPYVTQIVPNDYALGALASNYLINSLNGKGKVAIMTTDGIPWSRVRAELFQQVAKEYPGIEVVAVHQVNYANFNSDLLNATKAILAANPELNAILATISPYPTPIAAALKQAGATEKVKVVSFYDYPSERKLISEGDLSGVATASFPHNAYQAVDALAQYFGAHKPLSAAEQFALPLQYELVTSSNVPPGEEEPGTEAMVKFYENRWQSEFGK
ncbi:MAG: sugar ABC transporter substrate-binding protein [Actinobacteria bacterium]|nr:sugar ABC transporter substrate-binding protein [Actinomycetota bacterium]MBS1884711.1 sugar ABC transporter substrate-binding protein [Actinomycetota bacterium]